MQGNVDPRAVADGLLDGVVSQHDEAERIGGCRLDPVAAYFVGFRMAVGVLYVDRAVCQRFAGLLDGYRSGDGMRLCRRTQRQQAGEQKNQTFHGMRF